VCVREEVEILMNIFIIFRKFAENGAVSGILDLNSVPRRKTFKEGLRKAVCSTSSRRKPG